ncbi:RNA recognition motif domain [Macleaya cordata]|uniref:RNA recognition motif domain n=1 Tax=Macleaya cordata TaxID=56857 RepID=A0A200R7M0_MACCD|nr:RNA recognition motif domain [Macleaya cordata]
MGDFNNNNNNNDAFMRNRDAAVQARTKAQNRATVLQLKLIGQSHPTGLTNNLLKLFEPRPPLEYKPPPEKRKCLSYTGMAQFVGNFAEPGEPEYSPPVKEGETAVQRRARVHKLRLEEGAKRAAEELEKYDPSNDPNIVGDPYKTLFVARLNYETTEHRIKREFESYGPIKRVRMITDKVMNKPRGYAFIEYTHTRDMKAAYKQADGRKLDNRRVLVDVERGRTVPNWRPRRLGGGLGSTRVGGEEVNQKYSGREPQQVASGGAPRSEEPRSREERHVDRDREKSRERGRDKDMEHEKSRERSHDRTRDREPREDRHHRDRDRNRDRDRDRGRDHDRTRDRNRDRGRDHDRDRDQDRERDRDRGRDRPRDRDKDYERDPEQEGGRSRDNESSHDRVESKHRRSRHGERDRDPEHESGHGGYDHAEPGHDHDREPQGDRDRDRYDLDLDQDRYDQIEPENYQNDRATSEPRERERTRDHERDYQHSDRFSFNGYVLRVFGLAREIEGPSSILGLIPIVLPSV